MKSRVCACARATWASGPTASPAGAVQGLPFVTADGKQLKKNTKLYLSTTPQGGFCIEAESPGTLAQQRSFYIGDYSSRHLTYALLDRFMGPGSIDPVAQLDIGACFLYFANGFKFDEAEGVPGRIEESVELLRRSGDYLHPTGHLIAPEGHSVPGLQPDAPDAAGGLAEVGAAEEVPAPAAAPQASVVPQAAALTLARFSLPAAGVGSRREGGRTQQQERQPGRFDPGRAMQELWGRLTEHRFRT